MPSILDRFTTHLKHALNRAGVIAADAGVSAVAPAHLLLALSGERGSIAQEVLAKVRATPDAIQLAMGTPANLTEVSADEVASTVLRLTPTARRALEKAVLAAAEHEHRYVGSEHLLAGLAMIEDDGLAAVLRELRIDPRAIGQQLSAVLKSTSRFPELTAEFAPTPEAAPVEVKEGPAGASKSPALDFFSKDLTAPAIAAGIDPVIGRENEIERVIQILCRRTKNNPILLGEPGVGKTAIVEGLARRIVERDVPDLLVGKRILALDLALLVAGTIYRGEFESRLKQVLDEVRQDKDLILFIDEIHTIMGAGAASGSLDAANILKPALARGEIRCVGATTYDEHKKHIENDSALERRFQSVHVAEPSSAASAEILRGLKPYYEKFHRVKIEDGAVEAAVQLAERYIADRRFPDKAIDLIDEAAARLRVHAKNDPLLRKSSAIGAKLEQLEQAKRKAIAEERYDEARALRQETERLREESTAVRARIERRDVAPVGAVTAREVAAVVAQIIGIPVAEVLLEERDRLRTIGDRLHARIIGQDDAIRTIANAIQRAKSGLAHPRRPLASFLLLGPTGVGKTETAKALAELLFQHRDALIRLDMSEFSEGFTVSKLVGSPAGYVGYREGSKLTDAIRKRPASVVLFDEIEKAHSDVWNLLLQILEDGRLTDATGKESNFTNAVIILTSNVGTNAFTKASIGFLGGVLAAGALDDRFAEIREEALRELRAHFRPEFLNRIDAISVYRPLGRDHLAVIAGIQLREIADRLAQQQRMTLHTDEPVAAWIAARAFDPAQGARAVRRLLQEHLENPIASALLENRLHPGGALRARVRQDGTDIDIEPEKAPARTRSRVAAR